MKWFQTLRGKGVGNSSLSRKGKQKRCQPEEVDRMIAPCLSTDRKRPTPKDVHFLLTDTQKHSKQPSRGQERIWTIFREAVLNTQRNVDSGTDRSKNGIRQTRHKSDFNTVVGAKMMNNNVGTVGKDGEYYFSLPTKYWPLLEAGCQGWENNSLCYQSKSCVPRDFSCTKSQANNIQGNSQGSNRKACTVHCSFFLAPKYLSSFLFLFQDPSVIQRCNHPPLCF